MEQSVWEILNSALGTMWVILGFSILAMAIALERTIAQWNFLSRARTLADTVSRCLTRGAIDEGRSACERSRSPLADVFLVGYERLGRVKEANVNTAVHRERVRVLTSLKGPLWVLATIGATSPFVGLFGTVVGVLFGFDDLKRAESSGETAGIGVVSGHISEALIVTAAGILVAVVAVIIFNFFNQRLGRISIELKMLTDEFLEHLHEFGSDGEYASEPPKGKDKQSKRKSKEDADGDRDAA